MVSLSFVNRGQPLARAYPSVTLGRRRRKKEWANPAPHHASRCGEPQSRSEETAMRHPFDGILTSDLTAEPLSDLDLEALVGGAAARGARRLSGSTGPAT